MAGFSNISGDESIMFANNASFDGTERGGKMTTNGQLWIGATASPHVRLGSLASADSSVTITSGAGTIDLKVAGGSTSVITLTGDSGGAVPPTAGNINLIGYKTSLNTPIMATSKTNVSTMSVENRSWLTQFVVDPTSTTGDRGTFTTIASAIAAASSGNDIFIRPGTYTENLTLKVGVNLVGFAGDGETPNVTIIGKATLTTAGTVSIANIRLQTNSDFLLAVTGSVASIVSLTNCFLNCSNNTGISHTSSNASSSITLINCNSNLATTGIALYSKSSPGFIKILQGNHANTGASTTASTDSSTNGQVYLFGLSCNQAFSTSGSAGMNVFGGDIDTSAINTACFALTGTGLYQFTASFISSGTASCISVGTGVSGGMDNISLNSSNTNVVTGAGTTGYGSLIFTGNSSTNNITTQNPRVRSNDAQKVVTPGGYPYTTTAQDGLIKVDTSSARTITPLASPVTGQTHIIKDTVGTAGTNNITVTPSGKNIDGSASYTINVNYGSITIIYNGSEWSVV